MTIKDIAKAANVSIATVSKVLNGKDGSISEPTKNRILQIVKDANYIPYSKVLNQYTQQNGTIALLLPDISGPFFSQFTQQFLSIIQKTQYPLMLIIAPTLDEECEAIESLQGKGVAGLVAFPSCEQTCTLLTPQRSLAPAMVWGNVPAQQNPSVASLRCDYAAAAYSAVSSLIKAGSKTVAMLTQTTSHFVQKWLVDGYVQAMNEVSGVVDLSLIVNYSDAIENQLNWLTGIGVDGIVCENMHCALAVYTFLSKRSLTIPKDVALICLEDNACFEMLTPPLTAYQFNAKEMAEQCYQLLFNQLRPAPNQPALGPGTLPATLIHRNSVDRQLGDIDKKILVVGWINMDIYMEIPMQPTPGTVQTATNLHTFIGGKGANQAISAAILGANVVMLGVVGNDLQGKYIYAEMSQAGVDMQGVSFDNQLPTGTAYISLTPDGTSSIVGNTGANSCLDQAYLSQFNAMFESCQICVLQCEINKETLKYTLDLCTQYGAKAIVKPTMQPEKTFDNMLLASAFMVVANQEEIDQLIPQGQTVEEKARLLLACGITHVVVTMAEKGCYWVCSTQEMWFPGMPVHCVDSTGASDAFIGCLASMLLAGMSVERAIQYANAAAGYSVMGKGILHAVANRPTLDSFMQSFETMGKNEPSSGGFAP